MCDIEYNTVSEDPNVSVLIIQFLALRNLEGKELDDLKRLIVTYFPSLDIFRSCKQEILDLFLKNANVIFSEDYIDVLERSNQIRGTNVAHLAPNRRIIKSANRIMGRLRFFYNKLKQLLYGDVYSVSRDSSQETDIQIPLREQSVSLLSFERMKEDYENAINERDEMITSLQQQLHQARENDVDSLDAAIFELHLNEPLNQDAVDDLYETPPSIVMPLVNLIYMYMDTCILDPCAGNGMMSNYLLSQGYNVTARDLFSMELHHDFLVDSIPMETGFIVCHPPMVQENQFLQRCYELKKPFAILMSCQSLATEEVGELIHKNGANLYFLVGNQKFIYQNEEKPMGQFAWVLGNSLEISNKYYLIGHNWNEGTGVQVTSFDETSEGVEEKVDEEPTKKVVDEEDELICSICWDVLTNETIEFGENCAHPFCATCWTDYHKSTRHNRICPVCRKLLKEKHRRGRPRIHQ